MHTALVSGGCVPAGVVFDELSLSLVFHKVLFVSFLLFF